MKGNDPILVMDRYLSNAQQYTYYSYRLNEYVCYHWHNYIEITYIKEGSATHLLNNIPRRLRAHDLIFMLPNDAHMFYRDTDVEVCIFSFIPDFPFYETQKLLSSMTGRVVSLNDECRARIEGYLSLLGRLSTSCQTQNEHYIKCLVGALCSEILSSSVDPYVPTDAGITANNHSLNDILTYIDEHYTEQLTLKELSARFGYSYNYLSEYFRNNVNMNFSYYLNMLRIKYAISLMERQELSIEDIATKCGYHSAAYFSTTFKKYSGLTPFNYLRGVIKQRKQP